MAPLSVTYAAVTRKEVSHALPALEG